MQPLPNIEVLSFLNWMDVHGHAGNQLGVSPEELFLNGEYSELARDLEAEYMQSRRYDPDNGNASFAAYVDSFLGELRQHILKEYHPRPSLFRPYGRSGEDSYFEALDEVFQNFDRNMLRKMTRQLDTAPLRNFQYQRGALCDSVKVYLQHSQDPALFRYFLKKSDSVANTALGFVKWVRDKSALRDTHIRNVPSEILEAYIHEYMWSEYQRKGMSSQAKAKKEELLHRVLIQQKYDNYLANILTWADPQDYALNAVVRRSFHRSARYKCTLLAEDDAFCVLVRDHWEEMNSCSGDHLDIYYSEQELARRGRTTADKLNIRCNVSAYPAIYIWEYSLDEGLCIPVRGLDSDELMELFRLITDNIAKGCKLTEVVDGANQAVERMLENTAVNREKNFTEALLEACARLQTNENWVRNTDENGRNAYIKDLLEASGCQVSDQTLSGLSPTGKSAGEVDLMVFGPDGRAFTILEALNIHVRFPFAWDKEYFRTHVNKVYGYDAGGLARNYVIVYASGLNFGRFADEVYQMLSSRVDCPYGKAELIGVMPVDTGLTDLRLACARYLRNGKEVRLYVLCVRMAEKKAAPPAEK